MSENPILYEQAGGVLTITLNRPDKLNAFTDAMLLALQQSLATAENDPSVRALVITGAGRGFCPGQDLSEAQARVATGTDGAPSGYGEHLRRTYNPIILKMRTMPKPILTAINGVAAGAGMSLALAGDIKIASESASFIQAFVNIGLIPDSGSTWLLPRLIGMTAALEIMLTGRKVSADEALKLGMVNQVVPPDQLMPTTMALAEKLAAAPTKAIGYIKQSIAFSTTSTLADALENEAEIQALAGRTTDHVEGLAAFLEKRPPVYKGQ